MQPERHIVSLHRIVDALRSIPGCRAVELAHTESGRHTILAWFEDWQGLLRWYRSDFHRRLQATYFPDYTPGEPLADVATPDGPLVAAASLTLDPAMDPAAEMLRIDDLTVEVYTPLSADSLLGANLGPGQAQPD
jgi:hypothetical protein